MTRKSHVRSLSLGAGSLLALMLAACASDRAALPERCPAADAKAPGCTRDAALASREAPPDKLMAPPPALLVAASDTRPASPGAAETASAPAGRTTVSFGVDPLPVGALTALNPARRAKGPAGPALSLGQAVRQAVADNALIGVGQGRVAEARAGLGVSRSARYPQLDVSVAAGVGSVGNFHENGDIDYFSQQNVEGAMRSDVGLSGRQLIYDFGASASDVSRADAVRESEDFKLSDQTEEIAQKVTETYLLVLQQRELIAIAQDHVASLGLVMAMLDENQKAGNATVADIKRVRARLIDAQTAQADAEAELQTGSDRFRRLVHVAPGRLGKPPSLASQIPAAVEPAIAAMRKTNPAVRSAEATLRSARHELDSQEATGLPKLQLESEVKGQDFRTHDPYTALDAKVMVALRYRLMDGGLQDSLVDQIKAKMLQAEMRMRDASEEGEADIRQFYRVLATSRAKAEQLRSGVADSAKAQQLYEEQYKGGKRSLLELLDVQTAHYQARVNEVLNRYEESRAVYGILRQTGRLTQAMLASP